jgi:uncharacterized surface protein with fasciclin (FAS1) repeats
MDGGIIHVIDKFLQPPVDFLSAATAAGLSYYLAIVNKARFMRSYDPTLVGAAFTRSDFTLFAANSAVAVSQMDAAIKNGANFPNIFGYQLVAGSVIYSPMFKNGTQVTTASGLPLMVTILEDGTIYINGAKVIASDYLLSNGVMHVIDRLVSPLPNLS